jgi:hypothetical protein
VDPELFETKPILFGDFMKMGAEPSDRMYEELTDMNKLQNILNDVRYDLHSLCFCSMLYIKLKAIVNNSRCVL